MARKVKIKSYDELRNCSWFVEDMRRYCGMETEISCECSGLYYAYWLEGCGDWIWFDEGMIFLDDEEATEKLEKIREIVYEAVEYSQKASSDRELELHREQALMNIFHMFEYDRWN